MVDACSLVIKFNILISTTLNACEYKQTHLHLLSKRAVHKVNQKKQEMPNGVSLIAEKNNTRCTNKIFKNLEAGSTKDPYSGSGPRDVSVEVIEEFPGLIKS